MNISICALHFYQLLRPKRRWGTSRNADTSEKRSQNDVSLVGIKMDEFDLEHNEEQLPTSDSGSLLSKTENLMTMTTTIMIQILKKMLHESRTTLPIPRCDAPCQIRMTQKCLPAHYVPGH